MFQNLDMFKTAMSMARHAGLKQALTSQNVANSDTPGYRAMSVKSFADCFGSLSDMRSTSVGTLAMCYGAAWPESRRWLAHPQTT